ncbi:MAG TPA: NHLP family bacteriocin export ABC transporter peptidase/permease/ATPase subunit [Cyanothece sp. UBA12306]|nr:NHLP family bacteriocin export ABC transporter peptidase/permease/ATPase subunit [Cyanothece sp. UBA12306]
MRVKTPTILQMEAVECGAVALGIILAYYGRIVPLTELRIECGVSRDGSKASKVVLAARRYGMEANGYKIELEAIDQQQPPFIIFWEFNHFLVVEGFSKKRVFLNDPASGRRSVSWAEFDHGFTGIVLTFEPTENFKKGGIKPNIFLSIIKRLQGSLEGIVFCLIAGLLLVIPGITISVFSQIFIDNLLIENRLNWLRPLTLSLMIIISLQAMFTLLELRYLRRLKIRLAVEMSSQFLGHLLSLPISFYGQRSAGDISSRLIINNDVADILSGELAATIIDSIRIFFYGIIMWIYDPILSIIGIFFSGINIAVLQFISRQKIDGNLRLVQDEGKLYGISVAALKAIETLKSSALEGDFFAHWSGYYTKILNIQQELGIANQILGVLPTLLSSLTSTSILIIGGLRVMNGELTIGMLLAFQGLMIRFQAPVNTLVRFASILQDLAGDINRLDDVLTHPKDDILKQINDSNYSTLNSSFNNQLKGQIELKNITFGYSRVDPPLIENFSLSVQPGQHIALVGGSGCGKSTITKLICGLYQPWQGEIIIDGMMRNNIPHYLLINSLSLIEQEIFIFAGTVRDNLTLWNPHITDKNLNYACEDALIYETIIRVLGGYEGKLLEGGKNLSGGQRQRLEIARSLINNPTILVMDEATSALDQETEKQLMKNLKQRQCTLIIAAHRLSTIIDCDQIIVLDQGKVKERGTHQQLWENKGIYRNLVQAETE